jgi:hypothetical protein
MNTVEIKTIKKTLPIFTTILHNKDEMNAYLKEVIFEHRNNNPKSNESNVNAWHSNYGTHNDNPKFKPIIDLILNFCKFVSKDYFNCEVDFICFNFWVMMYEKGDYTKRHSHFPSDFAAVYYVDVEPGCAPIIFEDEIQVQPETGMLVIFPALLHHEVPKTDARRIAVSMNIDKKYVFDQ